MILTEEEAKTKRCQESFAAAEGLSTGGYTEAVPFPPNAISYGATGSYARQTAPSMCIGSACMAWRWWGTIEPGEFPRQRGPVFPHSGDSSIKRENSLGYCGKAGTP